MLTVGRIYKKSELSQIFGATSKQALTRKLTRYGVKYTVTGRGEQTTYQIQQIEDPFKIFVITELGFDANTVYTALQNHLDRRN